MPERQVFIDGRLVPETEAVVPITNSGFQFGYSVYEVTRTVRHTPFRLDEHLERLYRSCRGAFLDPGMDIAAMKDATLAVNDANLSLLGDNDDAVISHTISLQRVVPDYGIDADPQPSVIIDWRPVDFQRVAPLYETGVHLIVTSVRRTPPQCVDSKIKDRSRMNLVLALLEAKRADPNAIPLLLDIEGRVAETRGANLFIVSGGTLITPPIHNCLPGISRLHTVELAGTLGIPVVERHFTPYDVHTADEAFVCSTTVCMLAVTKMDHRPIADGNVGDVTQRLIRAWCDSLGVDFMEQARAHLPADARVRRSA